MAAVNHRHVRLSEIARLRLTDVQLPRRITQDPENAGMITVVGKRRKARHSTLNWKACEALKRYLDKRPDVPYQEIFITKFGKPMGPRSVENVVSKYLEQAGIAGATVHTMRHTFATSHVRNKTSLKVIQAALGHANLATTSCYVGLVAEEMNKQLQEHAL
jgi:site-specific recombinase XerD